MTRVSPHYPHLREDYPPAVALCASAASLSAREECGKRLPRILRGRPFARMPFSRPHDTTRDTPLSLLVSTRIRLWIQVNHLALPRSQTGLKQIRSKTRAADIVLRRNYANVKRAKSLSTLLLISGQGQ
ncbi:hypothetical protein PUN28_011047 [Cardiocondyla obscurior]|uniref:Uncharacterized protein n=1 Tax=Cardiocondyla obscurior TaxID=286306 RepID=A0AAW2FKD7_9HYME